MHINYTKYTYINSKPVAPTSTSVSPKPGGAWITPGHSPYTPQHQQQNSQPGKYFEEAQLKALHFS